METDFASVWSRVTGTDPAENELTMLQRWIRDETVTVRSFEALLRRRLPAPAAETLRVLQRRQQKQLRRLQTLYYLRTGDTLMISLPEATEKRSLMNTLREYYDTALNQAESYRRATAARRDIAEACAKLAEERDAQADALRHLTERLL